MPCTLALSSTDAVDSEHCLRPHGSKVMGFTAKLAGTEAAPDPQAGRGFEHWRVERRCPGSGILAQV